MKIKQGISGFGELKYFADNVQGITSHNLAEAVDYAHSRKCGVFVAVNDINVNVYGIEKALDKMRFLMDCGVDGFIVSSPEFVLKYPKKGRQPEWHLSCLAMCVNRPSLEFYRDMGIRRFAIYQSITPEEAICMFMNRLEVSANDIGTLAFLHRTFGKDISISIGRILTYLWSKNSVDFSREMGEIFSIGYFETDEANTANSMINAGLKTALHYPYRFYGVTRTCYYTKETLESCPRQCGDVFVPLGDGQVLWRGNAYYTKEVRMPEKMPHRLILSYSLHC